MDDAGREALLKYILRPSVAQERVTRGPEGLGRIALKKPFADGTVAVDMAPLSLLSRLAASVPPPKHAVASRSHETRRNRFDLPTPLPVNGATKADGYEGDGYVVIRHGSTAMVKRALKVVVETVKVHYA